MDFDNRAPAIPASEEQSPYRVYYQFAEGKCMKALRLEIFSGLWFFSSSCSSAAALIPIDSFHVELLNSSDNAVIYQQEIYRTVDQVNSQMNCNLENSVLRDPQTQKCVATHDTCESNVLKSEGYLPVPSDDISSVCANAQDFNR